MLLPAALVLVGAVALGLRLPPRYRAAALVLGEWDTRDDAAMRSRGIDVANRRSQAVRKRVLDRATIERLLQRAELGPRDRVPLPNEVERWLEVVRVQPEGANAFRIECVQPDATRAALIANLVATDLVEQTAGAEAKQGSLPPQLLEARLAEARRAMEESQAALQRVEPARAAARAEEPEEPEELLQQEDRAWAERRAVAASLATARARADRLRETIAIESRAPASAAPNPEAELERLRNELAELRKRYTEEHPDVERLVRRIRRLEDALPVQGASSPGRELREVEAEISTLAARLAAVESGARRLSQPVTPTPSPTIAPQEHTQDLASQYDRAKSAYQALLEEWQLAETAMRLGRGPTARFELLRSASVPAKPESPGLPLFALTGFALGLALGLAAALLAEMKDRTVKGPEDLLELSPLPLLATIPLVRSRGQRHGA